MTGHKITRKINKSKTIIYNFLKNPKEYGKKKRTSCHPTLNMRQKRAIVLRACLEKQNSIQIKTEMYLPCTSRTERIAQQKNSNVKYAELRLRQPLTKL